MLVYECALDAQTQLFFWGGGIPALHNSGLCSVHTLLMCSGQHFNCTTVCSLEPFDFYVNRCRLWRVKSHHSMICLFLSHHYHHHHVTRARAHTAFITQSKIPFMQSFDSRAQGRIMTVNYDYLTFRPFCIFLCNVVVVRVGGWGGINPLMLAACIRSTLPAI